ncbi:MAG TPA: PIN domain-containing protein [Chthoniobacterales bacterium]|nr:PIN domain-containing protein [Chthoniobacterales bacterium]
MIYLDTHVVVWLYAGEHSRLARTARRFIETESLLISPVLLLELALLEETGRIKVRAQAIIAELQESLALSICDLPFTEVAVVSLQQKWTRDPFDRLIVAQAAVRGARLITKDRLIRRHFKDVVW